MDGGFNEYDQYISDHRPVALKISTKPQTGSQNSLEFLVEPHR